MSERLQILLAQSAGFTLLDLLDRMNITSGERHELVQRVWSDLDHVDKVDIGERVLAGDVLNDDQVVTLMAFLLQELVAAIGHLAPSNVRLKHLAELEELRPSGPQSVLSSIRVQLGA